MRVLDWLVFLGFALFSILAVGAVTLAPRPGEPVMVLTSPFAGLHQTVEVVARADGFLVNDTGFGFALIATSSDPGFASALYEKGAWLVLSPRVFSSCFSITNNNLPRA